MIDRNELLAHPAGQAVQHVSQSDRREGRESELDRRKQIDLVKLRLEASEPACRALKTMSIDVEQDEPARPRVSRLIEEVSGADAGLQMVG